MTLQEFMLLSTIEKIDFVSSRVGLVFMSEFKMQEDVKNAKFENLLFLIGTELQEDGTRLRRVIDIAEITSEKNEKIIRDAMQMMNVFAPEGVVVHTVKGSEMIKAIAKDFMVEEIKERMKQESKQSDEDINMEDLPKEVIATLNALKQQFGENVQVKAVRVPASEKTSCNCERCACGSKDFEWDINKFGDLLKSEFDYIPTTEHRVSVTPDDQYAITEIPVGNTKIRIVVDQNYQIVKKEII